MSDLVQLQQSNERLNSIALLKKHGGFAVNVVNVKIQKIVLDIFDYFGESLSDSAFDMVATEIQTVGFMLNGADLDLFAENAKKGKYKNRVEFVDGHEFAVKFFKLTPDVLIDWLNVYIFERGEAFANTQKKRLDKDITPTEIKLVEIFANAVKKEPEPIKLSQEDEYKKALKEKYNAIVFEFRNLVEQQGREYNSGKQFVLIEGKEMDINEYLKYKEK